MSSEKRNIARAAGVVSGLTLMSRITGLVRDAVISYLFGAGIAAEAFFVAFRFPNLFRRLVAEGAMSVAFVPVFSDYLATRSREESERALRAVLGGACVVLVAMSAGGATMAGLWVDVFAPGFAATPPLRELAVELTRILFPYLTFIGLVAVLAGYLNAGRHFVAPALSPALFNVVLIAVGLTLHAVFGMQVQALAYGVLIGGACQLALQLAVVRARGTALRPLRELWQPHHEAVRRTLALLLPAALGMAIFQINLLVGTILASTLPLGSVSYLWYADRVFEFPLGLFVAALGTAALPSMSSQASRGDLPGMRDSLAFALSLMNFVAVPATVGLILLAEPITALLFQRGAFGAVETAMTAQALQAYALGLWPVAAVRLLAPAFYALGDARTPVYVAMIAVLTNVVSGVMLMGPVVAGAVPPWLVAIVDRISIADLDHVGLAFATSLAAIVNAACLAALLVRRLGARPSGVAGSLLRSVAATLPMGVAVYASTQWWWSAAGGTVERAYALGGSIAVGLIVFASTALLLGGREIDQARALLVARLRR